MTNKCWNGAHLRSLIRSGFTMQKNNKCMLIVELVFVLLEGFTSGQNLNLDPSEENYQSNLISGMTLLVMLTPFVFLFSGIYIFSEMVHERETRMKESLKIMGLNKWMYPLSFML